MQFTSLSEQDTYNFAKNFAGKLNGGEIIGLIGELGTGKTVFVKGLAAGLGIKKTVTSPTFIIMKIYPITDHECVKRLVHVDAYRINQAEELLNIGLNEYFNRDDTVVAIEWADKAKQILPKKSKKIVLKIKNNNNRIINYVKARPSI